MSKNKVTDYVTPAEACRAIGISEKSTPQILRWIKDGRIPGVFKFSSNWAIPVSWVKSECNSRGINWSGVPLHSGEVEVSLTNYMPISEVYKEDKKELDRIYKQMKRGTFQGDYILFGNAYGLKL